MENRKLFNVAGSKERLFEMMQKVGKVKLNEVEEGGFNSSPQLLEAAFNELKNGELNVQKTNSMTEGVDSFVEMICVDNGGHNIVFRFKASGSEGDQDGIFSINDASLVNFKFDNLAYDDKMGGMLNNFNAQHKAEIIDVVSEYADFDSEQPEIDEEYQKAIEKIDSYPFGGTPRTMVTSPQYGDQKPTNPALRVKSPELDKFVDEENIVLDNPFKANLGQHYYDKSSNSTKIKAIEDAIKFYEEQGINSHSMPHNKYMEMIKHTANLIFTDNMAAMNEAKKKKKEGSEYPDQIGSHFKPKSDYPVEKKKPTKVVSIDEYDTVENDGGRGMNNPNLEKFFDKKQPMHEDDEKSEETSDEISSIEQNREEQGEKLIGGKGDEATANDFDNEQVLMGLRVEMEHTDDPTVALEIVLDHLTEDPEYYTTKDNPEASAQANAAKEAGEDAPHASGAYVQDGMAGELDRNGNSIPAICPDFSKMGYNMGKNQEIGMSHAMDTTTGTEMTPHGNPDKDEEDVLLGFKPHNVGDDIEEAYGQPNPLKIQPFPKAGTVR